MILIIRNQTGVIKTYLSGAITVPAFGSTTVPVTYQFPIATDGQLRFDCNTGLVYVSDGVNNFASSNAISYLAQIPQNLPGIGQQVMDLSRPVVIASDQTPVPVTFVSTVGTVQSIYNEISGIAISATATVNTYTVPLATTAILQKVEMGGSNIAIYEVFVNAVKIDKKRTYFGGDLSTELDFTTSNSGITLNTGDILTVTVTNFRPMLGDFESRIQVLETT